jgi:hypothetical protein
MAIPPELLTQQNIMVVALLATCSTLFRLWTTARDTCTSADKVSAEQLRDQMILNERSLAQIAMREFERDQARRDADRCDRELERWRPGPSAPSEPKV